MMNVSTNNSLNVTVDFDNNTNTIADHWVIVNQIDIYGRIILNSIAVITNILVVATFSVSWKFWRHSTALLLLTLACIDIIGNGVCFIYYVLFIQNLIGDYSRPTFYYLINGFKRLSYLMMIPISANRYALICKPFTHHIITSKKSTLIQITTLTVFPFSAGIFELYHDQMNKSVYNICVLIFNITMVRVLPLIISFVLTVLVIREFKKMNRTLEYSTRTGAYFRQGERNVTRTMIAVNVAFIVLTLPAGLLYGICVQVKSNDCYSILKLLMLMNDINFSINIVLYILYLPKFRTTILGFFKCNCCRKQQMNQLQCSASEELQTGHNTSYLE